MSKDKQNPDHVPVGSETKDNVGVVDVEDEIGNKDLDDLDPALGDKAGADKDPEPKDDKKADSDPAKPGNAGTDETPVKYQGKSAEELLAILKDNETFSGKQSGEIGELRALIQSLQAENKQLKSGTPEAGTAAPVDPFEAKTAELEQSLEAGTITPAEYSKALIALNEVRTQKIVQDTIAQSQQQQQAEANTQAYLQMNPDFDQLRSQGVLDRIKAQFPVHDNVSAFEFAKRLEAEAEATKLRAELAELKQAQADAIANGRTGTQKVIQQPGVGTRTATQPSKKGSRSFNETSAVDSMLSALQRARQS